MKKLSLLAAAGVIFAGHAFALPPINGGNTTPFGAAPAAPAPAPEPVKNPNVFDDWAISVNSSPKSCVAFSEAKSKGKASAKRKEARLTVTRTPGGAEEFTVLMGYAQPAGTTGTVSIDGKSFKVIADKDALWSEKPEMDKDVIAALKSGSAVKVSAAGVEDSYSLKGFGDAYSAIGDKCK